MEKLISVIVPVYNVENYVSECLESITRQSYHNLEIILIDDGSQDTSGRICDEWAIKDSRIIVQHFENRGLSIARNEGLRIAKGEYISFVDSDDFIHPKTYEFLVCTIEREDADLVICHEKAFLDGENVVKDEYTKCIIQKVETQQQFMEHFMDFFTGPISWAWNKLFTRKLIHNNLFLPNKSIEDMMFMADISSNVEKAVWIEEKLIYYRQRESSLCGAGKKDNLKDYIEALIYDLQVFESNQSTDYVSRYLTFLLNKIAVCWVQAKKRKYIDTQKWLRDLLVTYFGLYHKNIYDGKSYMKLLLARYFSYIYYLMKYRKEC